MCGVLRWNMTDNISLCKPYTKFPPEEVLIYTIESSSCHIPDYLIDLIPKVNSHWIVAIVVQTAANNSYMSLTQLISSYGTNFIWKSAQYSIKKICPKKLRSTVTALTVILMFCTWNPTPIILIAMNIFLKKNDVELLSREIRFCFALTVSPYYRKLPDIPTIFNRLIVSSFCTWQWVVGSGR